MHVAAESPEYLDLMSSSRQSKLKKKRLHAAKFKASQLTSSKKSLKGKSRLFAMKSVFCQKYVKDNTITVAELVEKEGKRLNKQIAIKAFHRWKVGG